MVFLVASKQPVFGCYSVVKVRGENFARRPRQFGAQALWALWPLGPQ